MGDLCPGRVQEGAGSATSAAALQSLRRWCPAMNPQRTSHLVESCHDLTGDVVQGRLWNSSLENRDFLMAEGGSFLS